MIFNRNGKGNEELRILTGAYYKSNDFEKISVKVVLASEELVSLIGKDIFSLAETHYLGDHYLNEAVVVEPEETGSGSSGVGLPAADYKLRDQLVQHIQLPIAFLSAMWHSQGNDLSHEDSGRKNKLDKETESIAWEWQYNRDDAASLRNYQKALDRLIKFLNDHLASFPEWKDSEAKKNTLNLFISTAAHFNRLFAIDDSPVFFLRLAPIMREVERKHIKPILGTEKFNELKDLIQSGEAIEAEDQELIDYICDPIPLITMSMAVKRFAITVLPEGVVQNFFSERQTAKANIPATLDLVNNVSKSLLKDGMLVLDELKKFWSAQNADETDESIEEFVPGGNVSDKWFGL